jgi:hypothetical protein
VGETEWRKVKVTRMEIWEEHDRERKEATQNVKYMPLRYTGQWKHSSTQF